MTNNYDSLEMEIGCGKGKFLVARAQENQNIFFVGVDQEKRWMKRGAERAKKRNLENLSFVKGEVTQVLSLFPPESISVFHIYFPDPWPKRRHRQRRLLSVDFLHFLHHYLQPKGLIEMATDDLDYFDCIKKMVREMNGTWEKIRKAQNERLFPSSAQTNYERKYQMQGKRLYYLELQK